MLKLSWNAFKSWSWSRDQGLKVVSMQYKFQGFYYYKQAFVLFSSGGLFSYPAPIGVFGVCLWTGFFAMSFLLLAIHFFYRYLSITKQEFYNDSNYYNELQCEVHVPIHAEVRVGLGCRSCSRQSGYSINLLVHNVSDGERIQFFHPLTKTVF